VEYVGQGAGAAEEEEIWFGYCGVRAQIAETIEGENGVSAAGSFPNRFA